MRSLQTQYFLSHFSTLSFKNLNLTSVGKKVRPEMHCGICGEHGGDSLSAPFCHQIGVTQVSCSPFRVPIARLAAAQAKIKEEN